MSFWAGNHQPNLATLGTSNVFIIKWPVSVFICIFAKPIYDKVVISMYF